MLLGHAHTLPNGLRVRLRLAHGTDAPALRALASRCGRPVDDLEAHRLVRVAPHARVAVCATAWLEGRHQVVGYAAGDLDAGVPDVLLVDGGLAPGLHDVLDAAVAERAGTRPRDVA
ncbi:hypothetical protein [Conexibacter sp. SYSU D00693]|uniref:hypothetical protein n=1 Tax=Conexibacter sp. SYSU D00693 TaxID=2812560 RepID=UPI00196BAFAE|nr:hypothetical protein [Conexibacter sp. SYSU D00693]